MELLLHSEKCSIDFKLTITDDNIHLYFIAEDYYIFIENGRKANSKMPPVQAIKKWMIAKGIKDIGGTGYLISRSIGKETKANPYLREIKSNLKNYRIEIEEALNKDLKEELKEIVIKIKQNK